MRFIRRLPFLFVFALAVSSCSGSSSASVQEPVGQEELSIGQESALPNADVDATPEEPADAPEADDDSTVTQEEVEAGGVSSLRDDIAVRLIDAAPIGANGSATLSAEIFAVVDGSGDGFVEVPTLSIAADPGVAFTAVPNMCTVADQGVTCAAVETVLFLGEDSVVETEALLFEFEYSVGTDVQLPITFGLEASSYENPVSDDPDPSNNTLTIEVESAG